MKAVTEVVAGAYYQVSSYRSPGILPASSFYPPCFMRKLMVFGHDEEARTILGNIA